ncbi:acetyl-CoA C-acyltransferase [Candidatus Berkiella aquae]|uniref:acetyl-CoA C-acyltransferase n=1 Tax=Candidatus Berkiella aquae TaxID=295108 RepID=A0AAE3L9D7_9GAMM|nr:acetyl-CoA C-acyltransferase [Candidatus Berkiella aquae]
MQDAYIVAATRTAVGKAKGQFAKTRPDDLLSEVLKATYARVPELHKELIDDVVIGCAMPEAEQGMNVARIATLLAGLPINTPAQTVNRFCSSGLQTISTAANTIMLGMADVVIAGGVESMSAVPLGGYSFSANPRYVEEKEHQGIAYGMGITAEKVAKKWQISREAQDEFAFNSHQKALKAQQENAFAEQIVPTTVTQALPNLNHFEIVTERKVITQDQGPRADTTLEALAKLRPAFAMNGSVTAGNSSQMSDGAAALMVVSERMVSQYHLKPLARFCGFSTAGVEPEYMGIGPIEAIPKVLKQTNLNLSDISWFELNEAFAAQSLAVIKTLNLPIDKVNPQGGAIALGHPLGATGAILSTKLIYGAKAKGIRYGMVTMCIGTGMGAAGIFEIL